MLDVRTSRPLPDRLDAPAFAEPVRSEFASPPLASDDRDPLGAVRGVAAALVLSVPFWTVLIWARDLLTR
jgi:hypothetical protein